MELIADRYRLDDALGQGRTNAVFRAWDTQAERAVALKRMNAAIDADEQAQFVADGQAIAALDSPHIVPILDVGVTPDGRGFVVTPLIEGQTLAARLAEGPAPVQQMLQWGAEIADGLAVAHAAGQVHCHIRPSNIILENRPDGAAPVARLLDFGLATTFDGPAQDPETVDAPAYLPPEAWRGAYGPASDLYQLGLVLHAGLRGKPCFSGTPAALKRAHEAKDPPALLDVDPSVADTIMRLLGKASHIRPQKAAEIAATLRVLASQATARGYWPAAQTDRPAIIKKVWVFTTGSLVLVLAGILISSRLGEWDMPGSRIADAPPIVFPQSTASGWILPPAAAAASREAARAAAASAGSRGPAGNARLIVSPADATVRFGDTTCTASPCDLAITTPSAVRIERDGYQGRTVHLMPGVELRVTLTPVQTP